MIDYTKLTKAELITIIEEFNGQELEKKSKHEKEIKDLNDEIRRSNDEIRRLSDEIRRLSDEDSGFRNRVSELTNESFEKQRSIHTLTETTKRKDEQIGFLQNQLNGLSDLFNEIYLGLKDQNSLLGVYSRNINNFQERIDAKIAQFNTPPEEKNKK